MSDLGQIPTQVTINGIDFSPSIDLGSPFYLRRPIFGFGSPPIVSGQLTLIKQTNQELNPKRTGNFRPGNIVTIQIDKGSGFVDPPYGASLFIKDTSYQGTSQAFGREFGEEKLTIELVDALGFDKRPEPPSQTYTAALDDPITLREAVAQTLAPRAIVLAQEAGDPEPVRTVGIVYAKNQQGNSRIEFAHDFLWCSPDGDRQAYFLYSDNQNRARIGLLDLDAAPLLTLTRRECPGFTEGVGARTEQLPGAVIAESLITEVKVGDEPEDQLIQKFDNGVLYYQEQIQFSLPNLVSNTTQKEVIKKELEGDVLPNATTNNLIESLYSLEETNYDSEGKVTSIVESISYPLAKIDTTSNIQSRTLGSIKTTTYERDNQGRINKQEVEISKAQGLIAAEQGTSLEGAAATLAAYEVITTTWKRHRNGLWIRTVSYYNKVFPDQRAEPKTEIGSAYGPPQVGDRPSPYDLIDKKLTTTIPLSYGDLNQSGAIKVFADAVMAVSASTTFTGTGTHVGPSTTTTINNGSFTATDGTFSGVGFFYGIGTITGQILLARAKSLNLKNLSPNFVSMRRTAELEASFIVGLSNGARIELNPKDLPDGGIPPGQIYHIGQSSGFNLDIFLANGEELSFHEKVDDLPYSIYRIVGHLIGERVGSTNTPAIQSFSEGATYEDVAGILFEDSTQLTFEGA